MSVQRFFMEGGGSAANVAVGVSRLGFSSSFLGNVGDDYFGEYLIKEFEKENVDTSHLKKVKKKTGIAICIVDDKAERIIYAYGEANTQFSVKNINKTYIRNARVIYLSSLQGEKAFRTMIQAASLAEKYQVEVFFDPGYIYIEKGLPELTKILKRTTIVKFNEQEIKELTRSKSITEASKKILTIGPKVVLITLGSKGCSIESKEIKKIIPTYHRFRPVDKTGAGDSFNAGLISSYLQGMDIEDSVRFANLVASVSITKIGARSTPSLRELKTLKEFTAFKERFRK